MRAMALVVIFLVAGCAGDVPTNPIPPPPVINTGDDGPAYGPPVGLFDRQVQVACGPEWERIWPNGPPIPPPQVLVVDSGMGIMLSDEDFLGRLGRAYPGLFAGADCASADNDCCPQVIAPRRRGPAVHTERVDEGIRISGAWARAYDFFILSDERGVVGMVVRGTPAADGGMVFSFWGYAPEAEYGIALCSLDGGVYQLVDPSAGNSPGIEPVSSHRFGWVWHIFR